MTFTSVVKVSKKVCLVILLQVQTSRRLQMASQSPRTDSYALLIALYFPPNRVTIDVLVPPFILASSLSMRPFSFEHRAATESNLPLLKTSVAGPVPVQTILSSQREQNEHMASKFIADLVIHPVRGAVSRLVNWLMRCSDTRVTCARRKRLIHRAFLVLVGRGPFRRGEVLARGRKRTCREYR